MKKLAIAAVSVILLLALVGCGSFSYNIRKYVDIPEYDTITVKKTKIESEVKSTIESALSSYLKAKEPLTEGTVKDGDVTYINYKGTLVLYDGLFAIKYGEDSIKGLDEALKDKVFENGKLTVDVKLPAGFTFPEEIGASMLAKSVADTGSEETSETAATEEPTAEPTEEPTAEPTEEPEPAEYNPSVIAPVFYEGEDAADTEEPVATGSEETSTTAEPEDPYKIYNDYFAGKTVTVELAVEGKEGVIKNGEELAAKVRITHVFEGGTAQSEEGSELKIGSKSFIDGFESGMIGMSVAKGTKKSLDLKFPVPYSNNAVFSGQDVIFDVEIVSVYNVYDRDLDNADHFAAIKAEYEEKNGEGSFAYESKQAMEEALYPEAKAELAAEALVSKSKVTGWKYSDLEEYENKVINYYASYYYSITGQSPDYNTVLSTFFGGDEQNLVNTAGKQLKYDWVLYQLAKDKDLDSVSGDELDEYIAKAIEGSDISRDDYIERSGGKSEIKKTIIINKAAKWLGENTKEV